MKVNLSNQPKTSKIVKDEHLFFVLSFLIPNFVFDFAEEENLKNT